MDPQRILRPGDPSARLLTEALIEGAERAAAADRSRLAAELGAAVRIELAELLRSLGLIQ